MLVAVVAMSSQPPNFKHLGIFGVALQNFRSGVHWRDPILDVLNHTRPCCSLEGRCREGLGTYMVLGGSAIGTVVTW